MVWVAEGVPNQPTPYISQHFSYKTSKERCDWEKDKCNVLKDLKSALRPLWVTIHLFLAFAEVGASTWFKHDVISVQKLIRVEGGLWRCDVDKNWTVPACSVKFILCDSKLEPAIREWSWNLERRNEREDSVPSKVWSCALGREALCLHCHRLAHLVDMRCTLAQSSSVATWHLFCGKAALLLHVRWHDKGQSWFPLFSFAPFYAERSSFSLFSCTAQSALLPVSLAGQMGRSSIHFTSAAS